MSEIKGQILGVVLVLAIFGAIGTVLLTAFETSAKQVSEKITDDTVKKGTSAKEEIDNIETAETSLLEF